jgi:acetolactate synthase regulatory subunit
MQISNQGSAVGRQRQTGNLYGFSIAHLTSNEKQEWRGILPGHVNRRKLFRLCCHVDFQLSAIHGNVDMTVRRSSDWKLLAEQVSKEMDSEKLSILLTELNRVLDEEFGVTDQERSWVGEPL